MSSSRMNTPYDWILLGAATVGSLALIVANAVLLVHRKRSYFQAQGGVYFVLGSSLAGLAWIFPSFPTNGHFTRRGIFKICALWTTITGMGVTLWFAFTILRVHRMFRLSKGKNMWSWKQYVFVSLCVLPLVTLSFIPLKLDIFENSGRNEYGQREYCMMQKAWKVKIWFIVYPLNLVLIAVSLYKLRGQTDPLLVAEYRHTCEYVTMAVVVSLLSGFAILTEGSESVSGRCFLTFCICCLVFFHFWVLFGWPVYLCLFRPKAEMDALERELSQSGSRALQLIGGTYSQREHFQSSEGAILEAFSNATAEVDMYLEKIGKLEKQKEILQGKIYELKLNHAAIERLKSRRM